MGFLLGGLHDKLRRTISPRKGNMVISTPDDNDTIVPIPRGHVPVYVGKMQRRFVIPIWYLNNTLFQELLHLAEQEFGYNHPTGGLTIPCNEDYFLTLTSQLMN